MSYRKCFYNLFTVNILILKGMHSDDTIKINVTSTLIFQLEKLQFDLPVSAPDTLKGLVVKCNHFCSADTTKTLTRVLLIKTHYKQIIYIKYTNSLMILISGKTFI